ncbi:MAG: Abi family protein [Cyanobacteria bacterium]|nr:Abi family protein [Cyanobacteriota bacterium]
MTKQLFTKPALTVEDQIQKLQERGLNVEDLDEARHYLTYIGYYRFSGYCLPFQSNEQKPHLFKEGITFEQVLRCYTFDRELRVLVMDAIERIEVAFRASVSNGMSISIKNPFWFLDSRYFEKSDYWEHKDFLQELKNRIEKKRNQRFLKSYYGKYSNEFPPSWMIVEVLTLGDVSKMFASLKLEYRKAIARTMAFDEKIIKSWMQVITDLRNDCAHHARIYDRLFNSRPAIAKKHKEHLRQNQLNNDRFYAQAIVLFDLLTMVSPESKWNSRLQKILEKYSEISLKTLGFPESWTNYEFWGLS